MHGKWGRVGTSKEICGAVSRRGKYAGKSKKKKKKPTVMLLLIVWGCICQILSKAYPSFGPTYFDL